MKTQITFEQILPTPDPGLFAVVLVEGVPQVRIVELGEGLEFDADTGALTLTATAGTVPEKFDQLAIRQGDGTWLLPDTPIGKLQVALNGLHMTQFLDYTLSGAALSFIGQPAAVAGAYVSASYQY